MLGSVRTRLAAAFAALLAATFIALATGSVLIALSIGVLAAVALTFALGNVLLRPITGTTEVARRIARGNLHERVSPRPAGEVGELADAFNEMAHTVDQLVAAASADHSRMLAALNSSADAVVALNEHDTIAFANAAAGHLFFQRPQDLIGKPFAWTMPDAQVVELIRSSREEAQPRSLVVERPGRRFLQAIITPIVDGDEWASLMIFHDISEVRRAEQVRRDFVANVSHELRTPLAALKSVIDTLDAGAIEDTVTARQFLARADGEIDRLVAMVEELLQLSRIESGELPLAFREIQIRDVISTAVDRVRPEAEKQGLKITVSVPPSLPSITADRDLLERAMVNLIHNSVKFTPRGGSIDVSARSQDGSVTIDVSDTGEGIDQADLPRVFERFYKADRARRAEGTGLGLAIVKHTAEAHGGHVKAVSELGKGSTFSLSIPILPPA
jgi:two-component system, OmpR family, phosphate regulon sensor histidine kinase PhoR